MPRRFTITEKWKDPWLHSRSPKAKLLWIYLCDVCNIAGFWEIDLQRATFDTGISKRTIEGALMELQRGYESNGRFLWLRNFLKHQGNLPLNPNNPAHKGVITILNERKSFSDNITLILQGEEIKAPTKGLSSPISKGKGKGKGKGRGNGKGKYDEFFENFWKKFKGRWSVDKDRYVKVGKYEAWEEWQKLADNEKEKALVVADKVSGKYTPDACRWLKRKLFDDFAVRK